MFRTLLLSLMLLAAGPALAQVSQGVTVYNAGSSLGLVGKLKFSTGCVRTSSGVVTCTFSDFSGVTVNSPLSGLGTSGSHLTCPTCMVTGGDTTQTTGSIIIDRASGNTGLIAINDLNHVEQARLQASASSGFLKVTGFEAPGLTTKSGAGAIPITQGTVQLTTTAAQALTLADGSQTGQLLYVYMVTDGGDGTLTPTHVSGYTSIVFNDVRDCVLLQWTGSAWIILTNNGATVNP